MLKSLLKHLTAETWKGVVTRAASIITLTATFDQILTRFKLDLVNDYGISIPLYFSLVANVVLFVEFFVFYLSKNETETASDPQKTFVESLYGYVLFLNKEGKSKTILSIRDSLSHLLHLLGEHKYRADLGNLYLKASIEENSSLHRVHILIDDIGWANYLLNNRGLAEANIKRGIDAARKIPPGQTREYMSAQLAIAKGLRHLAVMDQDNSKSKTYLMEASTVVAGLESNEAIYSAFTDEIVRDRAQLKHAEATLLARSVGLLEKGKSSIELASNINTAKSILSLLDDAANGFELVGDKERLSKAYHLQEQVFLALNDETSSMEAHAKREKLSRTASVKHSNLR